MYLLTFILCIIVTVLASSAVGRFARNRGVSPLQANDLEWLTLILVSIVLALVFL